MSSTLTNSEYRISTGERSTYDLGHSDLLIPRSAKSKIAVDSYSELPPALPPQNLQDFLNVTSSEISINALSQDSVSVQWPQLDLPVSSSGISPLQETRPSSGSTSSKSRIPSAGREHRGSPLSFGKHSTLSPSKTPSSDHFRGDGSSLPPQQKQRVSFKVNANKADFVDTEAIFSASAFRSEDELRGVLLSNAELSTNQLERLNTTIIDLAAKVRLGKIPPIALALDGSIASSRPGSGESQGAGPFGKLFDSRKGIFITEIPKSLVDKPQKTQVTHRNVGMLSSDVSAKMVEFASFPGFEEKACTPLPHSINVFDIMEKTIQARKLKNQSGRWKDIFMSKETSFMVQDAFWWFFMNGWQREEKQQRNLFDRLSKTYVSIFMTFQIVDKDEFFWQYPDFLAQSIFYGFCFSFPKSIPQFNLEFRSQLSDTMIKWLTGLKYYVKNHLYWNMEILPRGDKGNEQVVIAPIKPDLPNVDHDLFTKLDKELARKENYVLHIESFAPNPRRPPRESCFTGPLSHSNRVEFDIFGNSPLVTHYLSVLRETHTERRHLNIHRSVVEPIEHGEGAFTYRDMLNQSKKVTKKLFKQFQKAHEDIQREKNRMMHDNAQEIHSIEKQAARILSRPADVKEMSIQLTQMAKFSNEMNIGGKASLKKMHVNYARKREKPMERIVFDPNRLLNRLKIG